MPERFPCGANTEQPDAALADQTAGELERMHEAAERAITASNTLAAAGHSVVSALMPGRKGIEAWTHYPGNDVRDGAHGVQFYYHAHPEDDRGADEHGHFHVFVYRGGVTAAKGGARGKSEHRGAEPPSHVIAIAMDRHSQPIELFTTNRWVTGERWLPAGELIPCVRTFELERRDPFPDTREWLAAMLALFRPQIEKLIADRDERIECWKRNVSGDAFENRDLNRVSRASIDLVAQVAAIEHLLGIMDRG